MPLGDFTKQLAQQALLSATTKDPPAAPPAENLGAIILAQLSAMQKALKDDEELAVWFANGAEKIRVMEVYMPSWRLAVLTGVDAERNLTRVIAPAASLELVTKVMKAHHGGKPARVALVAPKA